MSALRRAVVALGVFLLLLCVVGMLAAIWIVGPDSARMAGTSAVVGFVGLTLTAIGSSPEDLL